MTTIRLATAGDVPQLAESEASGAHAPWSASRIAEALLTPSNLTLIALDGPKVLGHALASVSADEGELWSLVVRPEYRRRGVAQALMEALRRHWIHRGVVLGYLEVRVDNAPALRLYRNDGWVEIARRRRYYADGTDAIVMSRPCD